MIKIIDIEIIIINIIVKYIRKNSLSFVNFSNLSDLFDSFENLEIFKINVVINNNNISRFQINNVKFFDSFYDEKFNDIKTNIKHVEKNTYFRNVIIFINKIKNVIRIKNEIFLKNNL